MILVECNPDAFVIRLLGFSRKSIKHEGGKGRVFEIVGKFSGSVGCVDADPGKTRPPSEIKDYDRKDAFGSLLLLVNKNDDMKRIIQISPYLEQWLIERARQNGVSPKQFHLPDDPEALHDVPRIETLENFNDFLESFIRKDEEAKRLVHWIKDIEG